MIKILIVSVLIIFTMSANAAMPPVVCNSVCIAKKASCTQLGKYRIYYRTVGTDSPTMIFSSGTGFPADGWFDSGIASAMAKKVKVFAYDRIYTFNSCPSFNNYMPNTAQDVVNNLHQLLQQLKIKPPYILVGHSIGGLYMLLFAREYPNEVAGLVLMDATSSQGPTPLPPKALPMLTKLGNPQNAVPGDPLYNEMIGQLPSYLQMDNAPPLPRNMPLIVMYATKHCLPPAWTQQQLMCMNKAEEENHVQQQKEIYQMSDVHQLIRVEGLHNSFFTAEKRPVVLQALNTILEMSKQNKQISK